MSVPAPSTADLETTVAASGARGTSATSPVAVVWCRQVDNEAESPGYTTVPEEFPGRRETLDIIRIVGNLTVNVADTHDYWDPDPTQPLSYYPNLFLYPAFGGRYTCVGRMFLSTEDRPRLGMKTLVLDTGQLLASGEFGTTILRWHASMGGPRRDGSRPPPIPDLNLAAVVGEGFLFHRGSTDPVLLVASEEWEPAMQTILEMVRTLPASLVALGAILAFPYFLPQPKTNLHEFTEQVPLSLALMRVGRGESTGDRHEKRLGAWESSSITVRDLTDGVPVPSTRPKDAIPLVLQYARDHAEAKLAPIAQRVDLVEMGRLRQHLTDPERQGGKDRRKEMWRIGTAMESAALLLQRSRGRHVPVNAETAKRAQEYMQARPPPVEAASEKPAPIVVSPAIVEAATASMPTGGSGHPGWLRPASDAPAAVPAGPEVVPVSVSDDPSLLPKSTPPTNGEAAPPGIASPALLDTSRFRQEIQRDLIRFFDERLEVLSAAASREAAQALEGRIGGMVERFLASRLSELQQQFTRDLATAVEAQERRVLERLNALRGTGGVEHEKFAADLRAAVERRLAEIAQDQSLAIGATTVQFNDRITDSESRQAKALEERATLLMGSFRDELARTLGPEVDRRAAALVDTRLPAAVEKAHAARADLLAREIDERVESSVRARFQTAEEESKAGLRVTSEELETRLTSAVDRALTGLEQDLAAKEEESRTSLASQVDRQVRELAERDASFRQTVEQRLEQSVARFTLDGESRRAKELQELEGRIGLLVDGRHRDLAEKTRSSIDEREARLLGSMDERQRAFENRLASQSEVKLNELRDGQLHAVAELQVRMQSYFEQKLRETQEKERDKYIELLARLKSEVDAALPKLLDSPRLEAMVKDRVAHGVELLRSENVSLLDERLAKAEDDLRVAALQATQRLEGVETTLADRNKELVRLEESLRDDLDELDRRTEVLSERLVPVVRKTWQRIGELEKSGPGGDPETLMGEVRREIHRETRRLEGEIAERTAEIRDRMETSIANQGKVWLTLIRQLSQLTENRRQAQEGAAPELVRPQINPMAPEAPVGAGGDGLDDVGELLRPRARRPGASAGRAPDRDDAPLDLEADPEREAPRRTRRGAGR